MADAVGVGVLDVLAQAIRAGVDRLAGKGIGMQHEAVAVVVELGVVGEQVPGEPPEPVVEAVEQAVALDADLLDDFLVEVVEQLLAGVPLAGGDFGFQFLLKLVELELNLLRRAAFLVDGGDALLEIHARFHGPEHLVAGAEHAVEEPELLVQQFVDPLVGGVASC